MLPGFVLANAAITLATPESIIPDLNSIDWPSPFFSASSSEILLARALEVATRAGSG
jgi:hypothetical protein